MFKVNVSEEWRNNFPGSHIGILLIGNIDNSKRATPLDERKKEIETRVREKYAGYSRDDLLKLDTLAAYRKYYKKFDKTYHVQLQLESVVHKQKSLPNVSPLVDACFASEMDTFLLTAGHDADLLEGAISIDVTSGTDSFTQMNGKPKTLKAGDMMMKDEKGVVCTIIYGQDQRTPISPKTKRALYVAYVPDGITRDAVVLHLDSIKDNVLLFAPELNVEYQDVQSA
jgi:DNA/RNA-binding domain of Phe-tRNA-synthetase-like protein